MEEREKISVKNFLEGKTLLAVETLKDYNLIYNLVTPEGVFGMDIDNSNVPNGLRLERVEDFVIYDDTLEANGLSINIAETNML
jgi:hypothetical protein